MKKLWTILCMAALLLCTGTQAFAAGTPTLTVGTVTAEAGKSIEVPISISNNTGICGAEISVSYDEALTLTAVTKGTGFSSLTLTKPGDLEANPVDLLWDNTEADYSNGTIATLTFTAPKTSGTYNISVSYADGDIVDGDIQPIRVNVVNGAVKVNSQEKVSDIFSDIPKGIWYEDAVQYVYDAGIILGNGNLFSPNDDTTRAMVSTILYRMEGTPEVTNYTKYNQFKDVTAGAWYADAVAWALNVGLATGDNYNMLYNPNASVTREQLATFLYRYVEYTGADVTVKGTYEELFGGAYVNEWAKAGFAWAIENGIIKGAEMSDGAGGVYYDLNPQGNATRAQMAAILQRICEKYQDSSVKATGSEYLTELGIPQDAFTWNSHYYAVFDDCSTWEQAKEKCELRGGHLATITSEMENAAVFDIMKKSGYDSAYFGFSDSVGGNWKWVNNETSEYSNWNASEPSGSENEDYAMFFAAYEDGTWNDGAFSENSYEGGNAYICEWERKIGIPSYAFEWNGHSYAVFDNCSTWEEAESYCEFRGGHLATITSEMENAAVFDIMKKSGYDDAYFGFSDSIDGNWKWVNNETSEYSNWNASEPSNSENEDYAMFFAAYADGTWNDGAFTENVHEGGNAFICEWD